MNIGDRVEYQAGTKSEYNGALGYIRSQGNGFGRWLVEWDKGSALARAVGGINGNALDTRYHHSESALKLVNEVYEYVPRQEADRDDDI